MVGMGKKKSKQESTTKQGKVSWGFEPTTSGIFDLDFNFHKTFSNFQRLNYKHEVQVPQEVNKS